ncbi:hypothetical protein PAP18089_01926 [Pandoraea apista]|uniref:Uncharacterized protein n=1 Tax=Pandoraea apista TaxID=93218 RepID=A0A5E5P3K6_9BURK|nr:hypothetical protein [Pandoraea apista]VVG70954.1 hypothetical protein PAP18089_01926 [Pandoraea apista]
MTVVFMGIDSESDEFNAWFSGPQADDSAFTVVKTTTSDPRYSTWFGAQPTFVQASVPQPQD